MSTYHFVGIGGVGMSALANILLQKGKKIQGSDEACTSITEDLKIAGAQIFSPYVVGLPDRCTVVVSSAIRPSHPEYQAAVQQQLPLIHRSQLLAHLMTDQKPLLITGSHGKTTTSSLLAHLLTVAKMEPSFAIGGFPINFAMNGKYGKGKYFVAEADESDASFLNYSAYGAVITNIEEEHLDHWKSQKNLVDGFKKFTERVSTLLWWFADSPHLASLSLKGKSYGFTPTSDLHIVSWCQVEWSLFFSCHYQGKEYRNIELPLIGKHNVANAAALFGLGLDLGIEELVIRAAFKSFKGIKRRVEKKGEKKGAVFYDDYAHHPNEIETTLKAVREAAGERRLVVIFQPHRYSRMRSFWKKLIASLSIADLIIVTDIYAAGEDPISAINIKQFQEDAESSLPLPVHYIPRTDLALMTASLIRPHDLVITLGAGDITLVSSELLQHEIPPFRLAICQGGKSAEHDISLRSAKNIIESLNPNYYTVYPFTLSKKGEWSVEGKNKSAPEIVKALLECDLAFPVLHGPYGEDGMVHAFFETLKIPSVGCDFRASVITMDKGWTKHVAAQHKIATARFIEFSSHQWNEGPEDVADLILKTFSFPFYIKAVHLGSSIGVYRIIDESSMKAALNSVTNLDYQFLVEEEVEGKEFEFGCLGHHKITVVGPIEITEKGAMYSYEDKYKPNLSCTAKVSLPSSLLEEGKRQAKILYKAFGCSGFARIDFFLTRENQWLLNEIQPIPGLTPLSGYPQMWKAKGIPLDQVLDQIIIASLHRHRYRERHLRPPP